MDSNFRPGVRRDITDASVVPVIWPFKATWMEHVGPEGLAEWEDAMRDQVGIAVDSRVSYKPGCATISGAGDGWGDCDYWGNGC